MKKKSPTSRFSRNQKKLVLNKAFMFNFLFFHYGYRFLLVWRSTIYLFSFVRLDLGLQLIVNSEPLRACLVRDSNPVLSDQNANHTPTVYCLWKKSLSVAKHITRRNIFTTWTIFRHTYEQCSIDYKQTFFSRISCNSFKSKS